MHKNICRYTHSTPSPDPCSLCFFVNNQNAFSTYDYTCPIYKSIGMLRTIITLYNCAQKAIADSPANQKVHSTPHPFTYRHRNK